MHTFRSHWVGSLTVLSVLILSGCGSSAETRMVAHIGSVKVTQSTVDNALRSSEVIQDLRLEKGQTVSRAQIEAVAEQAWVESWALRHHLTTMADAREAAQQQIHRDFSNRAGAQTLNTRLNEHHLSLQAFSDYVAGQALVRAAYRHVTHDVESPSSHDTYQYYLTNPQFFVAPSEILLRDITVHKRATAQSLMKKIQDGASFSALASRESIDSARLEGGSRGFIPLGATSTLPASWGDVVSSMLPGQMSIVKGRLGYSIIEVQASRAGVAIPFSTVQPEIEDRLMQQAKEQAFDHWVDGQMKTLHLIVE